MLKGRWRFFWGRWGTAGEVVLEEGDIFNIPTGIFRGFENIGTAYGMIMAVLGGDDAGGGVTWAPQVIEDAQSHGLVLGDNGKLYDSKKGESLPEGVEPMPLLTEAELKAFPEVPPEGVIGNYVARYWDLFALAANKPVGLLASRRLSVTSRGLKLTFLPVAQSRMKSAGMINQLCLCRSADSGRSKPRQTDKQIDRQTNKQMHRQTNKQVDRQTNKQIDRQAKLYSILVIPVCCTRA